MWKASPAERRAVLEFKHCYALLPSDRLKRVEGLPPERQGQNLVLTALYVSYSLQSGIVKSKHMQPPTHRHANNRVCSPENEKKST